MRILHLPGNVAGLPLGLVEGERALGHDARLLTTTSSSFGYPADYELHLDRKGRLGRWWTYAATLARITGSYDAFVFGFGQSLLHQPERGRPLMELPLYAGRAKKAFLFQGCDVRQKYPTMERNQRLGGRFAACLDDACYGGACLGGGKDRERRAMIERAERFADHMFAVNPDLLYFLPEGKASYLPYTVAHFHQLQPRPPTTGPVGPLHIVHGSTERVVKGTPGILAAMERLRDRHGAAFRFTLVEGMSYDAARRVFASADLYIDQMRVGWYGGAAVEMMKMGIPVVSFLDTDHLRFVPPEERDTPIIQADPETLVTVLDRLLRERDQLPEIARAGIAFADRVHAPEIVAKRMLDRLFAGGAPP